MTLTLTFRVFLRRMEPPVLCSTVATQPDIMPTFKKAFFSKWFIKNGGIAAETREK